MSDFIYCSVRSIVLSGILIFIVLGSLGYHLFVVRRKDELLRKREVMINGTIHDMEAPLNNAITTLSLLQEITTDEIIMKPLLRAKKRMKSLVVDIETLLLTAQGGERKLILSISEVDLNEVAKYARQDVDILFRDKPHTLDIQNNLSEGTTVPCDRMYIENVLRNLMVNAMKYSDEGFKVTVRLSNMTKGLMVSVLDEGWGIPQKDIRNLCEQFYRIPRKNAPRGYGIGLSFVKYALEAHKSKLCIKSKEGKGSEFSFVLPYKQ